MSRLKITLFFAVVLITYIIGFAVTFLVNFDYGNLHVNRFTITGDPEIAAIMYKPKGVSSTNTAPGVVLCHGISGSKEMMSQIALELAKNGFVAVTIDMVGHGDSGGSLGGFGFDSADKTLGIGNAVQYLIEQDYVDSSEIGLVGHSLGAGAVRATSLIFDNISASVFIGGGLGEPVDSSDYGVLNCTFPKNLLIVIGKHDVLFDLQKTKEEILPAFRNASDIVAGEVYGDFSDFSARSLVVPETTHLFEPSDSVTVTAVVTWMREALKGNDATGEVKLTYLTRELAVGICLISFVVLVFPLSLIILHLLHGDHNSEKISGSIDDWGLLIIWGTLGLGLFLPMFFVGSQIPFPPFLFGNSFSWWLLGIAITGLVVARFALTKFASIRFDLKSSLTQTLTTKNVLTAIIIFLVLYLVLFIAQSVTFNELKIIVLPVFKSLTNPSRILGFFTLIPFYFGYFFVESLYLFHYRVPGENLIVDFGKIVTIKVAPYVALIFVNYLPMFLFNFRVFPSFAGFIMEFVLGIIPLFMITIGYSWWFFRKGNNVGASVVLNTLLFAWSSAAIFPLSF